MSIFNRGKEIAELRKQIQALEEERNSSVLGGLYFNSGSSYNSEAAMKLSAVYCATNLISNSIANLPIQIVKSEKGKNTVDYDHALNYILNKEPDGINSHFMFIKQIVESVILRGAGYAYIERDQNLNVKRVLYINSDYVTPMKQSDGTMKYIVAGFDSAVGQDSMLDFHMHIDDQGCGISLLRYAYNALKLSKDEQDTASKFFSNGGSLAGILKPSAPINDTQRQQCAAAWRSSFEQPGTRTPVVILPYGLDFSPISVDPKDAQLLESREFSILEIARFFNLNPEKLYIYSTRVDAADEAESIQNIFYSDTLSPYINMMCEEMSRKIFKPSERVDYSIDMDFSATLRTDLNTQASYLRSLVTNGMCTINEARSKIGLSPMEGEEYDTCYLQLSYAGVKNIYDGVYVKQNAQDPSGNTKNDNKVVEKEE